MASGVPATSEVIRLMQEYKGVNYSSGVQDKDVTHARKDREKRIH